LGLRWEDPHLKTGRIAEQPDAFTSTEDAARPLSQASVPTREEVIGDSGERTVGPYERSGEAGIRGVLLTARAGPMKAEIASPVIEVMSASEIEPMPLSGPITERPIGVR
jgi:hypothetical protein